MKSIYIGKIEEETLAKYLPQVNMSERDKKIVRLYLDNKITYRDIGTQYEISGERVRQIIEKFARKAHYFQRKNDL